MFVKTSMIDGKILAFLSLTCCLWPLGWTNTPAVFQALVNDVIWELNRFVFVYLNDILIFSQNKQEHVENVHQVLRQLLGNQLFTKIEKCKFHVRAVFFLGFIISAVNFQIDPTKVSTVNE